MSLKIAVIDDELSLIENAFKAYQLFFNKDSEIHFFEESNLFIASMGNTNYDVIFIDICLNSNDISGFKLMHELNFKNETSSILIALTGNSVELAKDRANILGCSGFISKPITFKVIMKIIEVTTNAKDDKFYFSCGESNVRLHPNTNKDLYYKVLLTM